MIYKLTVPSVAEDVEEFRVLEWHGAPGQAFAPGDLVVELETHKAVVEVRAGQSAVLRRSLIAAGDWCGIGLPLALFGDDADETLPDTDQLAGDMLVEFEIV